MPAADSFHWVALANSTYIPIVRVSLSTYIIKYDIGAINQLKPERLLCITENAVRAERQVTKVGGQPGGDLTVDANVGVHAS